MSLHDQWVTVGYMLYAGAILGVTYDLCYILETKLQIGRWFGWLSAACYWLFAVLFVFDCIMQANDGQMRIYVPIFILLGGWLYFRVLSSRMRKFMVFLMLPIIVGKRWSNRCRRKKNGITKKNQV